MRKKLNKLSKTNSDEASDSDETSDNDNNDDSEDSEDNQIGNFVDRALKKVSKEIVNDDSKNDDIKNDDSKKLLKLSKENANLKKKLNISLKANQKTKKNITEQIKRWKLLKICLINKLAMLKSF